MKISKECTINTVKAMGDLLASEPIKMKTESAYLGGPFPDKNSINIEEYENIFKGIHTKEEDGVEKQQEENLREVIKEVMDIVDGKRTFTMSMDEKEVMDKFLETREQERFNWIKENK